VPATSLDLSQIKTDALSSASAFRALIGLGTLATQSPTGTPSASTFLRGDYSWQTIDLSGYVPYTGATTNVDLGSRTLFNRRIQFGTSINDAVLTLENAAIRFGYFNNGENRFYLSGGAMLFARGYEFGWTDGNSVIGTADLILARDSAATLGIRNSTNAQRLNLYGTFTDASNYRRLFLSSTTAGAFTLGVEGAGSGASGNTLALQTGGTTRLTIDASGNTGIVGSVNITNSTTGITLVNASDGQPSFTFGQANAISGIINTASNAFFNFNSGGAQNPARTVFASGRAGVSGGTTMLVMQGTGNVGIGGNVTNYDTLAGSSFVLTSGNAGLGTTSPAAKLDILDTTGAGSGSLQASALNIAQTWSTTGTPTAFKLNVTDTSSNANSLLLDLQVGGTSVYQVTKNGSIRFGSSARGFSVAGSSGVYYHAGSIGSSGRSVYFDLSRCSLPFDGRLSWTLSTDPGSTEQVVLVRDADAVLAQRNGTSAQTFRVYNTFTNSSNYERGKIEWSSNVLRIGTEKAGTGSARALELQTDGVTRLTIGTTSGTIASLTNLFIDVTTYFASTTLANSRVAIGNGVTVGSAFQFLFSSTTGANGTADTGLARSAAGKVVITNGSTGSGSLVFRDAGDMEFGTTTGTKIGTATTQKLGFYNATPVVQPTAVADATDAASVITQLNALLSRMRDLGLIAT